MKARTLVTAIALACTTQTASAALFDLAGLGYVQYGDALSYSLPIANYQFGYNTNNGPYAVRSVPGEIKSLTVVGTGSSGNPVVENFDGMDNAYATPSGVGGETFWYPNPYTYQGTQGTVANNEPNAWDTSLLALRNFLAGDDMIVFFNNNQVKSDGTAAQSLAAWAKVWVTDSAGALVGDYYYLTNDGGKYALVTEGGGGIFNGDPSLFTGSGSGPTHVDGDQTDYVLSGGSVCVAHNGNSASAPIPFACNATQPEIDALLISLGIDPTGWTLSAPIDHNLGADHAAYAVVFPELNDLLRSLFDDLGDGVLANYTLHADVRLGCESKEVINANPSGNEEPYGQTAYGESPDCTIYNGWGTGLNNGYEQIFISTTTFVQQIPEPGTLALLSAGLLGLFGARRRVGS
jgi:hypothetical protein